MKPYGRCQNQKLGADLFYCDVTLRFGSCLSLMHTLNVSLQVLRSQLLITSDHPFKLYKRRSSGLLNSAHIGSLWFNSQFGHGFMSHPYQIQIMT